MDEPAFGVKKAPFDKGFKILVHHCRILAWLLKYCAEPYRDCTIEEIVSLMTPYPDGFRVVGTETEIPSEDAEPPSLDNCFIVRHPKGGETGVVVDVEGQSGLKGFAEISARAVYYASCLVARQRTKGDKRPYSELREVYSIWVERDSRQDLTGTADLYQFGGRRTTGDGTPEPITKMNLAFVRIDEAKAGEPDAMGLMSALLAEMEERRKKELIEENYNIDVNQYLTQGLEMVSFSQDIYEGWYEKGIRDSAVNYVIALMKNAQVDVDTAIDMLDVPSANRDGIREAVNSRPPQSP